MIPMLVSSCIINAISSTTVLGMRELSVESVDRLELESNAQSVRL
jgi:hypothetical protein